jgi:hypothetical protein
MLKVRVLFDELLVVNDRGIKKAGEAFRTVFRGLFRVLLRRLKQASCKSILESKGIVRVRILTTHLNYFLYHPSLTEHLLFYWVQVPEKLTFLIPVVAVCNKNIIIPHKCRVSEIRISSNFRTLSKKAAKQGSSVIAVSL